MKAILQQFKQEPATQLWQSSALGQNLVVFESAQYRWLEVDGHVQSAMNLQQVSQACLPHAQLMAIAMLAKPARLLMAGLGGGDLLRLFSQLDSLQSSVCCELSAEVIQAYRQYFADPAGSQGLEILQEDINDIIPQCQRCFDLIVLDVFQGAEQPECLYNEAFYEACRRRLSSDGWLALNVRLGAAQQFLQLALLLRRVFSRKVLMLPVPDCDNVIVFTFNGSLPCRSNESFMAAVEALAQQLGAEIPLSLETLQSANVCLDNGELELWS